MKYILLILSVFSLSFMCDRQFVKVQDATSESWTGGMRGSGRGINYQITVVVSHSSDVLSFDSLWVGKRPFSIVASKPHPFTAADGFSKGDTVIIYASLHQTADSEGELIPLPEIEGCTPVCYTGDALLAFSHRKKQHYAEITEIRKLPHLAYP